MYGTIARLKVKPGKLNALTAFSDESRQPDRSVALFLFQMDADPDEIWAVSVAEDEASYRANSESPEMHKRYLQMREFLVQDPEWHDGQVIASRLG